MGEITVKDGIRPRMRALGKFSKDIAKEVESKTERKNTYVVYDGFRDPRFIIKERKSFFNREYLAKVLENGSPKNIAVYVWEEDILDAVQSTCKEYEDKFEKIDIYKEF